jgi:uncharacterized OB-fold protein
MDVPPQPFPDVDSEPFWQATAEGRLRLCRCTECRHWIQPPLERCPICEGPTGFEDASGEGRLYSYTVVRRAAVPGYQERVPYVVGLVELDEQPGLRLPALLPDVDPDAVAMGQFMRVEFVPLAGGTFSIPVFRAAPDALRADRE